MKIFNKVLPSTEQDKFEPIEADRNLFKGLQEELPAEPMIQLRPQKDSPGLEHGEELVRNLYHYREDKLGRNTSPINSFEIWFEEGQIRFYFHPDTREQKNSAKKHFEDKYPGTRMSEKENPFPQINEGDYIAGGRMTLSEHYARPVKTPDGPSSFGRDPFGSLTSEMVVEDERTQAGQRVRGDEVRMVIQCLFQPVSREWTQGGLFGTDLNDYADDLKKPRMKGSTGQQITRAIFGKEPAMREPTAKMKKTARLISKLRGEPGFLCRVRVLCISPYEEMARQHVNGVCEVFETYYNPVTEQGFETIPFADDELQELLRQAAARDMNHGSLDKFSSQRDLLSVPELAGVVHLPNESIQTPNVDWTSMEKGAGVPTTTPGLDDVNEEMQEEINKEQESSSSDEQNRMTTFSESDLDADDDDDFELTIDTADTFEHSTEQRTPADGRGLATDEVISEEMEHEENENPAQEQEGENKTQEQESARSKESEPSDPFSTEDESVAIDWEEELTDIDEKDIITEEDQKKQDNPPSPESEPAPQTDSTPEEEQSESEPAPQTDSTPEEEQSESEPAPQTDSTPEEETPKSDMTQENESTSEVMTQDDIPDAVLEELEGE